MTDTEGPFAAALARLVPIDPAARREAEERHLRLTKPAGSLGRVEAIGTQLSAISGVVPPPVPRPAAVAVFAGDHGVHAEGVSPWPQEVTAQMVANFVGGGAAISVLARQHGATVVVVDVGVATPVAPADGLLDRRVRSGTGNLAVEPAMSLDEMRRALDIGAEVAAELVTSGHRALLTGDMGIGNTTPSAAVIAALSKQSAATVTGRGTGVDDETLELKIQVVDRALSRLPESAGVERVLVEVGGLEIAALAGFIVAGAAARVPVIVDGVIAGAALLAAAQLAPDCVGYVIAGHRSVEPGASVVLDHLGLDPVLDLDLRLGEGTGACLALPIVEAATLVLGEMATFDTAGVAEGAP